MNLPITVVIPYYNESTSIEKTLECLERLSAKPSEIIFVDSGSTDDCPQKIDKWIQTKSSNGQSAINLRARTGVPSSSKNAGAKAASNPFIAFMDCGLRFPRNWLESQWKFINEMKSDLVSGYAKLKGDNFLDRMAVAQTYGYQRTRAVIPSTLVKREVFEKTGGFLEGRRAGYDIEWALRIKDLKFQRGLNENVIVEYEGINYTRSISHLYKKVREYSIPSVGMGRYQYPYYYMITSVLLIICGAAFPRSILPLATAYTVTRGIVIPLHKSRSFQIFRDEPLAILGLPLAGFIIDLAKLNGYFVGFVRGLKRTSP